ncbi:MAG: LytR C-terminal domain-containing protein, partial [Patescibacteria group bacterium]|nr:LytR C-terminal domain-containing protein [Patescibacteria group bacterium]
VNVGPVVMSGDQVAAQTSAPTVEVRNGSQKIGAANELADELKKVGVTVATVDNAANADYQATVLVNLTGKDVKPLEDKLQVTATDKLPDGEASSTADVVIILGNKK